MSSSSYSYHGSINTLDGTEKAQAVSVVSYTNTVAAEYETSASNKKKSGLKNVKDILVYLINTTRCSAQTLHLAV